MRRRTVAALAAVLGLFVLGCTPEDGGSDGKSQPQPPADAKDARTKCKGVIFYTPEDRCFTLQTFVESRVGPYDVYIGIEGGNGAYPPHVPIASGGWTHGVVYKTGQRLAITMTLTLDRPGSKEAYCSITDGPSNYVKDDSLRSIKAQGGAPYEVVCKLTTKQ